MKIVHLTRARLALAALGLAMVLGMALLLAGCFGGKKTSDAVTAATAEERVAYLQSFGWQVESQPVETLDLQLPDNLQEDWGSYIVLQQGQGLPFADYGGQTVRRYTYAVTNYPEIAKGVQANLFLCGDTVIGGDIIFTGQGGFQTDLSFPKA